MVKRAKKLPEKREPSSREAEHIRSAAESYDQRPDRTAAAAIDGAIGSPHRDEKGFAFSLMNTFATTSHAFMMEQIAYLSWAGSRRGETQDPAAGLNSSLALVECIRPANELEAALAIQMAGIHSLAAEMLGRAKKADRADHIALYGGLAVKLTRTFAAQAEALSKLRGGGKQQVEVRHVYVNGNAVIGDIQTGGGATPQLGRQPHAPCPALTICTEVRCPVQADGIAMQGACDAG